MLYESLACNKDGKILYLTVLMATIILHADFFFIKFDSKEGGQGP